MLSKDEIIRRLRALLDMPSEERPLGPFEFARLVDVDMAQLYRFAKSDPSKMRDVTQGRFSRALTWVENDQIYMKVRKLPRRNYPVRIFDPNPPCVLQRRIQVGPDGFKVVNTYVNPLAFPPKP